MKNNSQKGEKQHDLGKERKETDKDDQQIKSLTLWKGKYNRGEGLSQPNPQQGRQMAVFLETAKEGNGYKTFS